MGWTQSYDFPFWIYLYSSFQLPILSRLWVDIYKDYRPKRSSCFPVCYHPRLSGLTNMLTVLLIRFWKMFSVSQESLLIWITWRPRRDEKLLKRWLRDCSDSNIADMIQPVKLPVLFSLFYLLLVVHNNLSKTFLKMIANRNRRRLARLWWHDIDQKAWQSQGLGRWNCLE